MEKKVKTTTNLKKTKRVLEIDAILFPAIIPKWNFFLFFVLILNSLNLPHLNPPYLLQVKESLAYNSHSLRYLQ